ncbi:uncharacterized protein Bfra_006340 [Botrytis fragariae]|uniref:Apple domain-containing protein n=1 Tax=Botrytis fragariae TaxID=1964551 RepID=A0A8H6EP70_9HELO|nr:uncharacterized protein Bfra_006340 [Botrytis fragariae]KAF5879135.1 hypothetical protein Bfra_006340 [Botrytis fragariae]
MTRLTSKFFLFTIVSLAIASPLNPAVEIIARTAAPQDDTPTTTITATTTDLPTTTEVPTTTSTPTTSTTSSAAIATKTIDGCNVQGIADTALAARYFGSASYADILKCQSTCRGVTACISYSWTPLNSNCTLYNSWMDDFNTGDTSGYVLLSDDSGTFFSDKYPSDGSDFCYSAI